MRSVILFAALWLTAAAGPAATAKLIDVNALVAAGRAAITHSPSDIGSASNLFDRNETSLLRSAAVNPMFVRVAFTEAQTAGSLGALLSHASSHRWKAACAMSAADLDAQTGSYRLLTDWVAAGDRVWSRTDLTPSARFTVVEFTLERLVGDDYVHVNELEIAVAPPPFAFLAVQRDPLNGQVGVTWRSERDVAYEVLGSGDFSIWDVLGMAEAATTMTTFYDRDSPGLDARYYRVRPYVPPTIDLNVTHIERTPRYDYDAPKGWPEPGDTVTFHAHVRNWGNATVPSADYVWAVDGVPLMSGTLASLLPGEDRVVEYSWTWQDGPHTIGFTIDPENLVPEIVEENNEIVDRTNALAVGFWVEQSVYDFFQQRQVELGLGSNSWEDWAQRHIRRWNRMFEDAVWPLTPEGVIDRVRLDKVTVVPDGALPLSWGLPTNHPDTRDRTVDMMWGFPGEQVDGETYLGRHYLDPQGPFTYEGSLIHELNHARYLIDTYGFDVHGPQVLIEEGGQRIPGTQYMPYIAWEVVHYNNEGGMMSGDYTWFSEYDAACWNRITGRRAKGGNYNSPSSIGEWLNTDLPDTNKVTVVDRFGVPLAGADVRIYQAEGGTGWYAKTFDNVPDFILTADGEGAVWLPRNPFGATIRHTYGIANGVLIWRIETGGQVFYEFQEVTEYHKEFWRGNTDIGRLTIQVDTP